MNTDLVKLCRGISKAAWAYFFLYFDFNLFLLNVLPDFICFILLWQAIGLLSGEERDLELLRPLCVLLGARSGIDYLLSVFGISVSAMPLVDILILILDAAALYFHFQLFTDFARIANRYQGEGERLDRRLLRLRAVQIILTTLTAVVVYLFPQPQRYEMLYIAMTIAALVVAVMLMFGLFTLRRSLRNRMNAQELEEG